MCCEDEGADINVPSDKRQNVPLAEPEDDTTLSDDILACSDDEKNNGQIQQCEEAWEEWNIQNGIHDGTTNIPCSVALSVNGLYQDEARVERTMLEEHYSDKENCGPEVFLVDNTSSSDEFNILDFAEKYYNVHTHGSGHSNAFSKTVSMVRRRSLSVSNDFFILSLDSGIFIVVHNSKVIYF